MDQSQKADGQPYSDNLGRLPQPKDSQSVWFAAGILTLWICLFHHCLYGLRLSGSHSSSFMHVLLTFLAMEYLYTGLFVVAHDAFHGCISFRHRWLNNLLGRVAINLFAWFDYDKARQAHWDHHDNTGKLGSDPDFHRGNPNLFVWYLAMTREYLTAKQLLKVAAWLSFLYATGAPGRNIMLLFMAANLSGFRCFYFGTYIPHRPMHSPDEVMHWEKTHTEDASRLLSLWKAYHFDYHWEHHRWPYAPWWQLPAYRKLRLAAATAAKQH